MNTTTCGTCGKVENTTGPWNTFVVWCDDCTARLNTLRATREEILRLKALQSEGRLMSGMGVRPWDRERGAKTAERATIALVELFASLTIEDMHLLRDLEPVAA